MANSKPAVSVIIPNYNHAKYLKARIESVFNQTFTDFEIILLDDASSDNSIDVLTNYSKDPRVTHFIINSTNSGSPFNQWVKGIELANSDFIWIAESDDWSEKTFLESLLPFFSDPEIVLVASKSNLIREGSASDSGLIDDIYIDKKYNGIDLISSVLVYKNIFINASSIIFRKSGLNKNILKELLKFRFSGDRFLWINLLNNRFVYLSSSTLNNFRLHESSTTLKKDLNEEKIRIREWYRIYQFVNYNFLISSEVKRLAFMRISKRWWQVNNRDDKLSRGFWLFPNKKFIWYHLLNLLKLSKPV